MVTRGGSFRFEGLAKAGALFFVAMLVVLSVSSLKQLARTRTYLEKDLGRRLAGLADTIPHEVQEHYPEAAKDPYYLYAIVIRESLTGAALLDRNGTVIIDMLSSGNAKRKKETIGITPEQLSSVWRGQVVVSPFYRRYGTTVRSVYFPVKDKAGQTVAAGEATLSAGYIDDLTEQGTTYFFLKVTAAVFLLILVLYVLRTLLVSQRRLVQVAKGAGIGPGDQEGATDNVTFMVKTFQSVVSDLKEKEKELNELKERAEERARSVESYNENVLGSITSGVMTFDSEGVVRTANAAAGDILGISPGESAGRKAGAIFGPDSWVCGLVEKTLSEGVPERRGEGEVTAGKGSRWLGAGTSPLRGPDGRPTGAILVFTDITEVKELKERMELKERLTVLGDMSAGIAHELRNPMGVISGYAELLARDLADKPEAQGAVRDIQAEIRGMDEIIREFMNFSQPTELNVTEVDVGGLVEESVKALAGLGDRVTREVNIANGLPKVGGDAVLLRQAFINIVKNAIESMPDGGKVRISAGLVDTHASGSVLDVNLPAGRYVEVRFTDTGEGIDEKDMQRIFTPFFTTKGKGTGLGLALVQKILVFHGGRAAVTSLRGKGTTFRVYLPAKAL